MLSPLLILVAAAIKIDSPGAILYRQRRLGRHLRPFSVAKFRTMHAGVDAGVHRAHVEEMITDRGRGRPPDVQARGETIA